LQWPGHIALRLAAGQVLAKLSDYYSISCDMYHLSITQLKFIKSALILPLSIPERWNVTIFFGAKIMSTPVAGFLPRRLAFFFTGEGAE
jgi:hypothetical protein